MTRADIIDMARQVGFAMENSAAIQAAERFAALVAAAERESCALLCDRDTDWWKRAKAFQKSEEAKYLAGVIRDRGQAGTTIRSKESK
jgi:hypothetical protein